MAPLMAERKSCLLYFFRGDAHYQWSKVSFGGERSFSAFQMSRMLEFGFMLFISELMDQCGRAWPEIVFGAMVGIIGLRIAEAFEFRRNEFRVKFNGDRFTHARCIGWKEKRKKYGSYLLVGSDEITQLLLLIFERGVELFHLIEHVKLLGF